MTVCFTAGSRTSISNLAPGPGTSSIHPACRSVCREHVGFEEGFDSDFDGTLDSLGVDERESTSATWTSYQCLFDHLALGLDDVLQSLRDHRVSSAIRMRIMKRARLRPRWYLFLES